MTTRSEWEIVKKEIDPDSTEKLFFSDHEWDTVEAAAARIVPSDQDPGAREARVIVFIDRYLSGIEFYYASADGTGFLRMGGKEARSARQRLADLQQLYRTGIRQLDKLAQDAGSADFVSAAEDMQDKLLAQLSGNPKPESISLTSKEVYYSRLQGNTDEDKSFFDTLCFHVRQGFYSDPVYGGNKNAVGWQVIGFPGPKTLRDTMDGTYTTASYFVEDYKWEELLRYYEPGDTES